jgi:toxin ParE1/3/4
LTRSNWRIRLGREAERDFVLILHYTKDNFGERQAEAYRAALLEAIAALDKGPDVPGSAAREEIQPGLRSFHIARKGRPGRHFVMYRVAPGDVMEIVRILYDAMDLARHVPPIP